MIYTQKAAELRNILKEQLYPLITGPYVYLDLPYYTNIGDTLLWEGSRQLFKECGKKNIYQTSLFKYKLADIPEDAVILLHAGGNFGDLWRRHQEFRLKVIERYPKNKIIILPQSVYYENSDLVKSDALKMARHENLYIFARDNVSLNFLNAHFKNNVGLLPDMAFGIDPDTFAPWLIKEENKILFLKRNDKELNTGRGAVDFAAKYGDIPVEQHDWPTMEKRFDPERRIAKMIKLKIIPESFINYYADNYFRPKMLQQGAAFISRYKYIYTTRLHGAIFAFLLGKQCGVFDNSYNKTGNFVNTWLKDCSQIKMYD